ncbi:mycofactocin system FadH/OYE family oxidoreductase 1 [Saccharothrix luteola]|uniref:mycofactocin system FadH/OYE family oxidoreductase 1 n=1 Tax=Saccharothrix luteola TaxID=2893018 RepID=UPI001E3B9CBA|nr:mycofactocin system FadH/OYE family oxidoreductase 1 [Saccharothrix luteola]MCC8245600.1 mycofactocin system FadH/OYE family oxidoreductase 1 [Saccharothrix luteola]
MNALTGPVALAGRTAPSRVLFGPHETNLGDGRALSERHVAYYERRAAGGAGLIVTETASVHDSDWPYERAPLAMSCADGWRAVVAACRPHGALVLAGLGHAGSQGSSAYGQRALWGPSRVADVVSRELPAEVEEREIAALVAGFAAAAASAVACDLDGVEVDAGQYSLLRQFLSGLTNQRGDRYGEDRTALLVEVLAAVRGELGDGRVLGLRLSCDELAPWAGITPEHAVSSFAGFADVVDYVVPVRGSAMNLSATRPDSHTEPGFNAGLCRAVREAVSGRAAVVWQGSVVDPGAARAGIEDGTADLVEMTRAQIAEPRLVSLVRAGTPERIRPCVLCNQFCRVRDSRNPRVSCLGEPSSGYEGEEPAVDLPWPGSGSNGRAGSGSASDEVLVVGGGPAGLEAARVLALRGRSVRLVEQEDRLGGTLSVAAQLAGRSRLAELAQWLEREVRRLGVRVETGTRVDLSDLDPATPVLLATGSVAGPRAYTSDGPVVETRDLLAGLAAGARVDDLVPAGPVLVVDPVGDWTGAGTAELLAAAGRDTAIVTQDPVIATQLAIIGDLAAANTRLQVAGVRLHKRAMLRRVLDGRAELVNVITGVESTVDCAVVVHCGHRLPAPTPAGLPSAGDCVAPRTVHQAVLEGRRVARSMATRPTPVLGRV